MQAACSRLAARVSAHGAASSSCSSLGRRQGGVPGTPLACGLATMVRPPSVRDAQTRIFGWAQPDVRRGESRQGHAPLKTLEKLKRHGLIGQKVRARSCVAAWRDLDLQPRWKCSIRAALPVDAAAPRFAARQVVDYFPTQNITGLAKHPLVRQARPCTCCAHMPRTTRRPCSHERRVVSAADRLAAWAGSRIVRGKRGLAPDPRPPARLAQALNQERQEKLALQKQLGQSPPKKGQGKRASKKK